MNKFETLKLALNLKADPIGVKLIFEHNKNDDIDSKFKEANKLERYCQFVKRASQGEFLKLKKGDFLCVTGEIMLGFKKPEHIEINSRLDVEGLSHLLLYPINKHDENNFNCVLLIVTPRNCMDIIEAYVKIKNHPLEISCGAYTGVCSEATAHVIKNEDMNFSFLCSGARIFAEFDDCDMLCGIPGKMTDELINEIINIIQDREADMELMRQSKDFN